MITDPTQVIIRSGATARVGENVILDINARTIAVMAPIDRRTLYSAIKEYWLVESGMVVYEFPFAIDGKGQPELANNWGFLDRESERNVRSQQAEQLMEQANGLRPDALATIAKGLFPELKPPTTLAEAMVMECACRFVALMTGHRPQVPQ